MQVVISELQKHKIRKVSCVAQSVSNRGLCYIQSFLQTLIMVSKPYAGANYMLQLMDKYQWRPSCSLQAKPTSLVFRSFARLETQDKACLADMLRNIGGLGDCCMKTRKLDRVAADISEPERAQVASR